jgi:GNAT superfamily N-acetyltransferase
MTPALRIRDAGREDLPSVLGLYQASGIGPIEGNDPAGAAAVFERQHALGARVLLAEAAERPLGTLTLFVLPLLGHGGAPEALVEDVAVHPDAQGQGVGRALMHEAMACARAAGCYKLALTSNVKRLGAHAFYDSLGFERHGISFVVALENRA